MFHFFQGCREDQLIGYNMSRNNVRYDKFLFQILYLKESNTSINRLRQYLIDIEEFCTLNYQIIVALLLSIFPFFPRAILLLGRLCLLISINSFYLETYEDQIYWFSIHWDCDGEISFEKEDKTCQQCSKKY